MEDRISETPITMEEPASEQLQTLTYAPVILTGHELLMLAAAGGLKGFRCLLREELSLPDPEQSIYTWMGMKQEEILDEKETVREPYASLIRELKSASSLLLLYTRYSTDARLCVYTGENRLVLAEPSERDQNSIRLWTQSRQAFCREMLQEGWLADLTYEHETTAVPRILLRRCGRLPVLTGEGRISKEVFPDVVRLVMERYDMQTASVTERLMTIEYDYKEFLLHGTDDLRVCPAQREHAAAVLREFCRR
ncbi:MAG: hypothetical protein IKE03_03680 [Blautia sp.]|nr:hypothetical protein [Blautia sp.]